MLENDKQLNFQQKFILWFAAIVVFLIIVFCFAVSFGKVRNENFANFALGALISAGFNGIMSYFYNSSKSSKDKDATIATLAKGNNPPPPVVDNDININTEDGKPS